MLFRTFLLGVRVPAPTSRIRALAAPSMRLVHTLALSHLSPSIHSQPSSRARPRSHLYRAQSSPQAHGALRTARASFSTGAHSAGEHWQRMVDDLPKEYMQAIQQELLHLMHERPEILSAAKEFMQAFRDNGMDFPARVSPTEMDYFKFVAQEDLSETFMEMCRAFINVGIDIWQQENLVPLMEMQHVVEDL